jgi:drug/metabolite transporter (DMT)-like permease
MAVGAGAAEAGANLLFLAGTKEGLLAVVAVLTSLYPAATVGLARAFLGERIGRPQFVGLVTAGVAVALLVAG